MADIRKPDLIMLLRFSGKRKALKLELFRAQQWGHGGTRKVYRLRMNGKWFQGKKDQERDYKDFYTFYEFRDLLWRSLKIKM
jgi:hypothetical protein